MAESAPAGDGVVHAFGIGAAAVRRLRIGLAVAGVLFAALVVWLAREEGFGALYVSTLTAVAAMCRALASATVVEERLVIFGRGGIQLEAVDMLGRTTEEYIERRRFRAIVMNEYVTPLRVRNVLTLIFCDGEVRPLFQACRLRLEDMVGVYSSLVKVFPNRSAHEEETKLGGGSAELRKHKTA